MRLPAAVLSWPEFAWLMQGLLTADTRLYRHFKPVDQPNPEE